MPILINKEEILEKIDAQKELLSTMPKNNEKNIEKYLDKIKELKKEYKEQEENIVKIFNKRYKKATEISRSKEIDNLEIRRNTIEKILGLLNLEKTSYEKMELDKIIYKIDRYYKDNLENVNEQIELAIKKFEDVGIKLELADFNYSIHVTQYMKVFFEEMRRGNVNSTRMKRKFEKIYWKCSDIILHIELNLRYLYLKNQVQIDKYFEKETTNILKQWGKSPEEIIKSYLEIKMQRDIEIAKDKKQIIDSFLNGRFNIKDFEQSKIQNNYSRIFTQNIIDKLEKEQDEVEKGVLEFLNSLYEYKKYMKFKFIIEDMQKYYNEKEKYKNSYKDSKKQIEVLEKKLRKLNKKLSHKGLFKKKEKEIKQSAEQKQLTTDIKKAYKELDINKFYTKIYTDIKSDSTIFEMLKLANSYYNYLIKCMIEHDTKITQEQMNEQINELNEFVNNPYNNIITNLTIIDQVDVAVIIKDRYKLLNFNIEKEDFSMKNVELLISILENIEKTFCIKKSGLEIQEIEEIMKLKEVLKL